VKRAAVLFALVGCALVVPAFAQAAPKIQRPNPLFVGIRLDYISPLPTPSGGVATLNSEPLHAVQPAVTDMDGLKYSSPADLGYFVVAPKGKTFAAGGTRLVGALKPSEIPLYGVYAHTKVKSYTFVNGFPSGAFPAGQGGATFVPGLGVPPVVPAPSNSNTTPPANQGFAGKPGGTTTVSVTTTVPGQTNRTTTNRTPPTTTRRRTTTKPKTTTAPTTTTVPTTTAPTTTAETTTSPTTTNSHPPPPPPVDCGTIDVSVTSDLNCLFIITNAKPGDSITENYTIINSGDTAYDVALQITNDDPPDNHLWGDLTMGIWETPGPAPSPFPPLSDWTPSHITLDHLPPGGTMHVRIDCLLPTTAGNIDMRMAAVMTLNWLATG
jgi:hypothetical protein